MKKKIITILSVLAVFAGCTKVEKIEIQVPVIPGSDEERAEKADYYANLRAYKESDHVLSYVFMGRYATLEGAENLNVEYATLEHRFIALPDSLDIVNLWMGAPYPTDHSDFCWYKDGPGGTKVADYGYDYSPAAYADMQYCREVKGTKFVLHADASKYGQQFDLIDPRLDAEGNPVLDENGKPVNDTTHYTLSRNVKASQEAYAEFLYRKCLAYKIDGLDFDYEGWDATRIENVINYLAPKMGPQAETEEGKKLLLIIDYWSSIPPSSTFAKCSYIVRQAYSVQLGINSSSSLGGTGIPNDKYIICEQWEQGSPVNYTQGGKRWGNPSTNENGEDLYSMEAYALYCKQGNAKGFGAYYIDNDYKYSVTSSRGTFPTYGYLRNAIRAANPIKEAQPNEEGE